MISGHTHTAAHFTHDSEGRILMVKRSHDKPAMHGYADADV